jgi:tetratricopeptide (TPR) repeat protein
MPNQDTSRSQPIQFGLERNQRAMSNLRDCVRSASLIISTASTIVSSRSTTRQASQANSEFDLGISEQKRISIKRWIPEPTIREEGNEGTIAESEGSSSIQFSQSDSTAQERFYFKGSVPPSILMEGATVHDDLDIEEELIRDWLILARTNYSQEKYSEAEAFLETVLRRSKAKYGTQFEGKDEVLDLLATSCYRQKKWTEAEGYLLALLHGRREADMSALETVHMLAEVYLLMEKMDLAERFGRRAVQGKVKRYGRRHAMTYQSIFLLARICESQGNTVEARAYYAILPTAIRGTRPCPKPPQGSN